MMANRPEIAVVGSGASGLGAAWRLHQAGYGVHLLESDPVVGGKLRTHERDGFLIDDGAFFMPTTHRNLLAIADEAGIGDELKPGGFVLAVMRDGQIHEIDGDHLIRDFLRTPLLSTRAKVKAARLITEVARARRATFDRMPEAARYDDDSVASWADKHLDREVYDYLVGTMMRAMFNCELDTLPRVEFLAIIAFFAGAKLSAFTGGMGAYADAVARHFLDVQVNAECVGVSERGNGVDVSWRDGDGAEHTLDVAGCVLATPAARTLQLHPGIDPWRRANMARVKNGHSLCFTVGLSRPPEGIGATYMMIPPKTHPFLVGVCFHHHKAPGRVPPGKGLLSLATVAQWLEQQAHEDDATISGMMLEALEQIFPGVTGDVEFTEVNRWRQEYNPVGYYKDLGRFRTACEDNDRRIQLAGDYHSSQNLNGATCAGEAAARRLMQVV